MIPESIVRNTRSVVATTEERVGHSRFSEAALDEMAQDLNCNHYWGWLRIARAWIQPRDDQHDLWIEIP